MEIRKKMWDRNKYTKETGWTRDQGVSVETVENPHSPFSHMLEPSRTAKNRDRDFFYLVLGVAIGVFLSGWISTL